jgi:hypothetical protein
MEVDLKEMDGQRVLYAVFVIDGSSKHVGLSCVEKTVNCMLKNRG